MAGIQEGAAELMELFQLPGEPATFINGDDDEHHEHKLSAEDKLAMLPLPGPDTDLDGKARNRLIVRRYYYRKLTNLNELRAEVERLEDRYQQLLREEQAMAARPSAMGEQSHQTRRQETHAAYVELARLSDALRRENEELLRTTSDYEKMERQLSTLYISQCKSAERTHTMLEEKKANPGIQVRTITSEECADIMARAYKRIEAHRESTESFMNGASVFGWHDRYRYENKNLSFSLQKTFRHQTLDTLASKTWELIQCGETFAELFPSSLQASFFELQRLDDNNLVYYHTLQLGAKTDIRTKSVVLCSRTSVMDGDGCLLVFRSLNPRNFVLNEGGVKPGRDRRGRQKIEIQAEENWTNMFIWLLFQRSTEDGEHCVTEFGGTMFESPLLPASWWLVERLQCTMKVEQRVFGGPGLLAV
ncbi:hypothetical protein Poli38472_014255 [Pythium oligandrum]|uniref:Uncharacterized protein n=1 Tax=Pythium oligandrum TaxID=41045 RepID=A0A8K1FMZ7_PYTOL|nr:hypothetical protein Poli38472_014255 [Pythium oligandrum]|eukprot:TMW64138.1 hypothetical protein Poli38472_014255 [Pythium oligandrum]